MAAMEAEEFDFELVSHVGDPLKPGQSGSQRYMGAMEDNMTAIMPLTLDSFNSEETSAEDHLHHREMTPG